MIALVRSELRKLITTRMPWVFLVVLVVIAGTTGAAVASGTDVDGSKGFVATAADQQSLVAFGGNAMIIAGLFGAVAVAREYAHNTVIPTFISTPRRLRVVAAQSVAVGGGGAAIGAVGGALSVAALAAALPGTGFGFLIAGPDVLRVLAAAAFCGAAGALLGAGIGAAVRNPGGAVAGTVLALVIAPPLLVQLIDDAAEWVPTSLAIALSGVPPEAAAVPSETGPGTAAVALALWGLLPAAAGSAMVVRRDVT